MRKKRLLICLALLAALLVANLVMIQAASSSDLTFTLNAEGTGYVVSKCSTAATGTLSIPATYSGKPVVEIGREAFLNCTKLTSVTIPTSVQTIGWYAFSGCTGLTSISIPDSVTTLDWFAFSGCTGLTSATIGNGVTCIDAAAFSGCTNLTTVTVGNSVTSIGWSAFKGCTKLSSINIPNGVTSIDRYAFYGCSSLSSVTYCGTQEEWNAITKGEANTALTNATLKLHNLVNKTCTICQYYDGCKHTTTQTVQENLQPATCTTAGSYDSVVNCASCGEEMSRETITVNATGHNYIGSECSNCDCPIGDIDGNGIVDHNDAIYLLLHTMFNETSYPLYGAPADFDGNGTIEQDDAVYLLLHTMFGESFYPISASN